MPNLTPDDLIDATRRTGYIGVRDAGGPKPFQAQKRVAPGKNGVVTIGTRRATARESAQDYCDYVNSNGLAHNAQPVLKTAGHNGRRASLPMNDEVQEALGILRDARAARAGKQGYVYLIQESSSASGSHYGKIGYSTNPPARVAELQTGNPRTLRLMGQIPGTETDEAAMHAKYHKYNVLQEWFWITDEIRAEFGVPSANVARVVA